MSFQNPAMCADNALTRLHDDELCIATMKDGTEREVRWSKLNGCFFYAHTATPTICHGDDINEWRPASIKF